MRKFLFLSAPAGLASAEPDGRAWAPPAGIMLAPPKLGDLGGALGWGGLAAAR